MLNLSLFALPVLMAPMLPPLAPTQSPAARVESASWSSAKITFGAMGTEVTIKGYHADEAHLAKALAAAKAELDRVEDMMTSWRDSPLVRMNDGANGEPQAVPKELSDLVQRSLTLARLSGGAFDPTYASVGKLWDFKAKPPVLPNDDAIAAALTNVGWGKVRVDTEASTVAMPAGTRLGLGGIAKGYGVDRAMKVLMDHGIEHALVNAGGDLKALGTNGGEPWEVAIKHPRDREKAIAVIPVSNVCLVTSGDYERFFELDGVRYHHIFDPRTGRPVVGGCMSASVTAPDAALADAVATAVCVLGPELGLQLVETLPRIDVLLVDMQGEVQMSSGLKTALGK